MGIGSVRAADDGIAIIGIGCRFPGGANSPAQFWQLLRDGVDAITEMPADRFDLDRLYDPDPSKPGRMYVRWGGFMDRVDGFDGAFFGISPREVLRMDPQQRILLEIAWEALEDAGQAPARLAGSRVGVFIGISTHDYADIEMYPVNRTLLDAHSNTGTATSIAANRLSYLFDLRGPSLCVDTACSSALTAVHLACQSLRSGESTAAIAGGVQLLLAPELTMGFCRAGMLSPDGHCKAFDAAANGYVRSEGAGVVVLKPLTAALANGDPIYAVIRGTAINQDGRTNGMTVPSVAAQAEMLREALTMAGVDPSEVQYIEAHGTGTPVGDPLEAAALGAVLGVGRAADTPCLIGSVKTNIGHLEAASGIAGLIKTALALKHRQVPPSLHFHQANPAIPFDELRLRVATSLQPWPARPGLATAGVNAFGFGGANAHVVLREASSVVLNQEDTWAGDSGGESTDANVLALSARGEAALRAQVRAHMDHLAGADTGALRDVCYTSALRRGQHDYRVAVVGTSREELLDGLDAYLAGEHRAVLASGRMPAAGPPQLAFVFSGMGPQWWGMGRQLMAQDPIFRSVIERCDTLLRPLADWSLLEELARDEATSRVGEADLAQVTNFAIQVALAAVWQAWGIRPDAVIGHSAGEMAAAHVAGALDLADCMTLAYHRSRLQARATGAGKMLAVGLPRADVERIVARHSPDVSLAAVNSPTSATLSGDASALAAIAEELQQQGAFARFLAVAVPYHSPAMDAIRDDLLEALHGLQPRSGTLPMVSEVTREEIDGAALDAGYWWRNVREPVLFADGIDQLVRGGWTTFLEVGPHPALGGSITECLASRGTTGVVLPSLRRGEHERATLLRSLGALWAGGREVDWQAVFRPGGRHVALPPYPWQRERAWFVSNDGSSPPGHRRTDGEHPLLGHRVRAAQATWEWAPDADDAALSYLADHVVQGAPVLPGAAYVEMALAGAREIFGRGGGFTLRDIEISRALFLAPDTQLVHLSVESDSHRFRVHSARDGSRDGGWSLHARGYLVAEAPAASTVDVDLEAIRLRCWRAVPRADYYAALARRGLDLGSAFQGVARLWQGDGEALASIEVEDGRVRDGMAAYLFHPAVLDAAFQPLIGAAASADSGSASGTFLPVAIGEVRLLRPPGTVLWSHARVVRRTAREVEGDITIYDAAGQVVADVRGLRGQFLDDPGPGQAETLADWLYDDIWEEKALDTLAGVEVGAAAAPARDAALAQVQAEANELSRLTGWSAYYTAVEPRLEDVAAVYAYRALRDLGWDPRPGNVVEAAPLAAQLNVQQRFVRLVGRALLALERQGVLTAEPRDGRGRWRISRLLETRDPAAIAGKLAAEWPAYAPDVCLVQRCGLHLGAVLRGEADPHAVLFEGDAFALVARLYQDAPSSAYYNALLADAVSALAAEADVTRPLHVLEVGGGTGGTTSFVLPRLARHVGPVEYVFTDISPAFTEPVRQRFESTEGVAFTTRLLDVESDPAAQGLADGSFHLVIAANVLHATASLAESLGHARRLLAPGGALVLVEITRRPFWLDLVFGLTDGWWRFAERDQALRPDHPLLEAERWGTLLAEHGFADVMVIRDTEASSASGQSVVVGRSTGQPLPVAPVAPTERWILFADRRGVARRLANRLEAADSRRTCVLLDSAETGLAEFGVLLGAAPPVAGVIHMGSLDLPPLDDETTTAADLLAAQHRGSGHAVQVAQVLASSGGPTPSLWLVTAGAQPGVPHEDAEPVASAIEQAPLWGVARVLMKEVPALRCRAIDLGREADEPAVDALAREIGAGADEEEVAFHGGRRFVRRLRRTGMEVTQASLDLVQRPPRTGEAFHATIGMPGALETVGLVGIEQQEPGSGEVALAIQAAAVNFREVMLAMGLIPELASEGTFGGRALGMDCAGTVVALGPGVDELRVGDEVMGVAAGTFGNYVVTSASLVARRPPRLTWEDAAGVPVAFVTAQYALHELARLRVGERVLIHAASGGVGLAAIQIAREAGAEVFATAGNADKRAYLSSLGVQHVMDSRSFTWAEEVLRRTDGHGVDVILNSLAGEAISRGIGVLAPYGRFVELGKRDIYQDSMLGLKALRRNGSFFAVDVDRLCHERPAHAGTMLRRIAGKLADGTYRPLPFRVFPVSQVEDALRYMAQARHIGKIIISLDDPDVRLSGARPDTRLCRQDAAYLITGGLGGFGLTVADWLVANGAGTLVLLGRSKPTAAQQERLKRLRSRGAQVVVAQGDVADETSVRRALDASAAPLRGIVHAAMALDDAALEQLTPLRLERVLAPKVAGAWNVHRLTRDRPLDFFVCFSSIVSLLGNPLQANYAAANAFLDALAAYRRSSGLPALTINWGVLSGVGFVAERPELAAYLEEQGYRSFTPDQALEVLGAALRRDHGQVMAARIDWLAWARSAPVQASSPRLRHLVPVARNGPPEPRGSATLLESVADQPLEERQAQVVRYLREKVGRVLGTSASGLDTECPLTDMGLDSLIAVELVTALRTDMGVDLPVVKLLQGPSITGLAALILAAAPDVAPAQPAADGAPAAARPAGAGAMQPPVAAPAEASGPPSRIGTPKPHLPSTPPSPAQVEPAPPPGTGAGTAGVPTLQRLGRAFFGTVFSLATHLDVQGLEHVPPRGGFILAVNHLSYADAPLFLAVLPRRIVLLAAEEYRHLPLMHLAMTRVGEAIYIRRGEHDQAALERGLDVLRAGGALGIGPEGTRSKHGALGPGRTGVAYLAQRGGVPVIPAVAWGQEDLGGSWRRLRRPGVHIRVGAPIQFPRSDGDIGLLREQADQVMLALARLLPERYRGVYAEHVRAEGAATALTRNGA